MKRKYIGILLSGLLALSCSPDIDHVFNESPDERMEAALAEYNQIITSSENGWVLSMQTLLDGGYNFWVKFTSDNRVKMLCDADATTTELGDCSTYQWESSWRLKSVQTPVLMFDTYNYIHYLADPADYTGYGSAADGYGLKTDFEYRIDSYDKETGVITLTGRYNKTIARMRPCSAAEYAGIEQGGLKKVHTDIHDYLTENLRYPVLDFGSKKVDVVIGSRTLGIQYVNAEDEAVSVSVDAYIGDEALDGSQALSNIYLFEPLEYEGQEFNALIYSDGAYHANVGGTAVPVVDNGKPALPFRFGYGKDFTTMSWDATTLAGTLVDPYLSDVYIAAKDEMYNGSAKRTLLSAKVLFLYDQAKGRPYMQLQLVYKNSAGSKYTAKWNFAYTANDDGSITFTDRDQTGSSNERGQEPFLKPIVDYFCTVNYDGYSTSSSSGTWAKNKARVTEVIPHTFSFDWVENNTPGLSAMIGGFYPVDEDYLSQVGICCGTVDK